MHANRPATRPLRSRLIPALLSLALPAAFAQGMDQAQMQQMMEQAQKMQDCMGQMSEDDMAAMQKEGEKIHSAIEALCKAGKRDAAQEQAMAYGKQMASSPQMQKMRGCGESMHGMMPGMDSHEQGHSDAGHVCDQH